MPVKVTVEIAQQICGIAKLIYDQVMLAKANKAQCSELSIRVRLVESTILKLKLDQSPDTDAYRSSLRTMVNCLSEALVFVKGFADVNWFRKILKAGTHQSEFANLFDKLYQASQLLNLGLSIQQIINHDATRKAMRKDAEANAANQDKIIELCEQSLAGFNKIQDQQLVLERQLRSMRLQFDKVSLREQKEKPQSKQKANSALSIADKYILHSYDLAFDQKIDQGSFATIFAGRWEGHAVAIKFIEGDLSADQQKQFVREVEIMHLLNNPAIPQFFGANMEANQAYLVMEYMPLRSLSDYQRSTTLTALEQYDLACQIASGLTYLHRQGVIHCDLKGRNILLAKKDERLVAKITDYGLSHLLHDKGIAPIDEVSQALAFSAPEMLLDSTAITPAIDIFSFGSLLWQLLRGKEPFDGISNELLLPRLKKGEQESLRDIPPQYASIISACWHKDPAMRPTPSEILQKLLVCKPAPVASAAPVVIHLADVKEAHGMAAEQNQEYKLARQHYEAAISAGSVKAKTKLATLLLTDNGGPIDKTRAAVLFKEAAEKGHDRAIHNLAVMCCNGDVHDRDAKQGIKLFIKAAERGHVASMQQLAKIYETGLYGTAKNPKLAAEWRIKSSSGPKLLSHKELPSSVFDTVAIAPTLTS